MVHKPRLSKINEWKTGGYVDKIFDPEVEKYLLDAGVTKQTIAKIKFDKLKEGVLAQLRKVCENIDQNKFTDIPKFLAESPAGDGNGCDNHYINFGYIIKKDNFLDIEEVTSLLCSFKEQSKEK